MRVLHVDDDADFLDVTAAYVTQLGSDVEWEVTTDGEDALALLSAGFDCIVSDFDMPGMDGLAVLEAVRAVDPELPFVLFTGKGSEEIASRAISEGVSDYIQKGNGGQFTLLLNRIENLVAGYRAERTLRERLQAIETASEGIGILDEEGIYTYMNRAYAEMFGYEPEDIIGNHWAMLYDPDEVRRFEEDILPLLVENGTWHGESIGKRADGTPVPETVSLTQLDDGGHVCVIRDVTERDDLRQSLEHERDLVERVFETSPVGVLVFDATGTIVRANDAAASVLGLDPDDVEGQTYHGACWDLRNPDGSERPNDSFPFRQVLDTGEKLVEDHISVALPDGGRVELRTSGAPLVGLDGSVEHVVLTIEDVTELEASRRRLTACVDALDTFDVKLAELDGAIAVANAHLGLATETDKIGHVAATQGELRHVSQLLSELDSLVDEAARDTDDEDVNRLLAS
ncbi:PAS domain S-box protein [Haloarchaeobius sp. DFWS5]|uniref:PAS domain-containing protein n=1 Tax=Haloarchaeobius sp. DFWS5 TaxID=3446114 RepID=UPI003EC08ED6